MLSSQLGSGSPAFGVNLELAVITAVILGGASLSGGRGTILGTALGLLIIGVLANGLVPDERQLLLARRRERPAADHGGEL